MPKNPAPPKKKVPAPLFDNSTRGYLSTRITTSAVDSSESSSRRYATHSQIIPALPKPLFGTFDETLFARPDDFYLEESDSMDVDGAPSNNEAIDSGLPGIAIKVRKRYRNSVCLSLSLPLLPPNWIVLGCAPRHLGRFSQRVLGRVDDSRGPRSICFAVQWLCRGESPVSVQRL